MLTNLIGVTVAGSEADRVGPARPLLIVVALFELGLLVSGFAPSMHVLIAGRAVQGLGAGVIGSIPALQFLLPGTMRAIPVGHTSTG